MPDTKLVENRNQVGLVTRTQMLATVGFYYIKVHRCVVI